MMERSTPFSCVSAALACALSGDRHSAARPAMARAADTHLGEPGPLTGNDGAAEMATARRFLELRLSPLHFAALYAQHGQRKTRCNCCGGVGDHVEWLASLRLLASGLADFLGMRSVNAEMRFALVRKHFDADWKPTLDQLARDNECSLSSAERASTRTADWIRGTRRKKGCVNPVFGVEQAATAEAQAILRDGGFIP